LFTSHPAEEDVMGRFRDRMDDDLRIRGYSANTRASYLRCVRHFVRHFMRPPDQLTPEHIRQYQLYLTRDRQVSWPYFNQAVCALRFFYRQVLQTDWAVAQIPYQRTGRRLPEILSPQEVAALFRATANLKHRALLMTMYAGGLRVSEVTHLRVTDIDEQRGVIRIEQGIVTAP
jgi:integrase/recombinase XerD